LPRLHDGRAEHRVFRRRANSAPARRSALLDQAALRFDAIIKHLQDTMRRALVIEAAAAARSTP
jgi:hypothetical protein